MGRRPTLDTSMARYETDQRTSLGVSTTATHEYASDTDNAASSGGEEEYALAMHDFIPKAPNATCLSFRAGQVIHVLNRHDTGWWDGELEGRRGWFPSNYVSAHEIKSVPASTTTRNPRALQQSSTVTRTVARPRASLSVSSSSSHASSHDGPDTPPDESCPPLMGSLLHAIHLLGNAVRANRVSHFQPSTACIISCVRSVLSATECLARESPYLKLYPTLASERKHILAELAKLVAQSRKASRELPEDVDAEALRERDEDAEDMIRLGGNVFIAVRRFLGKAEDSGVELPQPRTNLFSASSFNDGSDHESRSSHVSSVRTHSRNSTAGRRSPVSRASANGRTSPLRVGGRRSPSRKVHLTGRKSPTSPTSPHGPASHSSAVKTARSMVDLRPQRRMDELRHQQRVALEATQRRERAVRTAEARRPDRSQDTEDSAAESTDSSAAPLVTGVGSVHDKRHRYTSPRDYSSTAHARKAGGSGTQSHHRATPSVASSISSAVSYSSISSNSSFGSPLDKVAIPTQPLTPAEVFTLANAAHDALLSIIAALIGHVHTHTAHSVVREPLASLTVEVVNASDDLRTIVVGVRDFALATITQDTARLRASLDGNEPVPPPATGVDRFKGREIVALTTAHDGLHQLCKLLLRTVGEYYDIDSAPLPDSLTFEERTARFVQQATAEERCKSATLNVATGVLRAGGECHTVVKNSLSRRFGVEGLLITLAPQPAASRASTSASSAPSSPKEPLAQPQPATSSSVTVLRVRPNRSASVSASPSLSTVPDMSVATSFATPQSAFLSRTRRATSLTGLNGQYQRDGMHPANFEDEDLTVQTRSWALSRGVPALSPTQALTPSPSVHGSNSTGALSATTITPSAIPSSTSVPHGLSSDGSMVTNISQSSSVGSRFSFHLNDKRDRSGSVDDDGAATDATSVSGSLHGDSSDKVGRSSQDSFSPLLAVEEEQEQAEVTTEADDDEDSLINGREEKVLARNSIDFQGSVDLHSIDMHSVNMHSDDELAYTARRSSDAAQSEDSVGSRARTNRRSRSPNSPSKASRQSLEEKRLRGDLPAVPRISVDVNPPSGRATPAGPTTPDNAVSDQPAHWITSPSHTSGEIVYSPDGGLVAATLKALVEKMTPHDAMRDAQFSSVFFLTFRLFTTPMELVDALITRYNLAPDALLSAEDQQSWAENKLLAIRSRIVTVIKNWLEIHWHRVTDNVVLPKLEVFVSELANGTFGPPAYRILEMIKIKGDPEQAARLMHPLPDRRPDAAFPPLTPISPIPFPTATTEIPRPSMNRALIASLRSKSYSTISILDFDCLELARQLTIMESVLYCKVPPEEILEVGERPTVHIKAISTLSNAITGWVAESLLKHDLESRKRTALLKFFIKLAERCVGLNNFSTPRAILAALDSSTISRLSTVWSGLPQKNRQQLEELRKLADHARNCGYYRSRLRQTAAPAVPFMGIFLTDITFTKEGNKPTRPSPKLPEVTLINYSRYNRLAKVVQDVQRLQAPYNLKEVPEVQAYLTQQFEPLKDGGDSQALYRRSLIVEPRQNADEPKQTKASDLFGWATRS